MKHYSSLGLRILRSTPFGILLAVLSGTVNAEENTVHTPHAEIQTVTSIPSLVAFWTFQESPGEQRSSIYPTRRAFPLREENGPIQRFSGGLFGDYSIHLQEGQWLRLPHHDCGTLNIHGATAQVSVVAWLKRENKKSGYCEAVAGMWNEQDEARQYALFLALPREHGRLTDQVGGHVSSTGGNDPGRDFSTLSAVGATPVSLDTWHCIGFTYDGTEIRAYLDGEFDPRQGESPNPYPHQGGIFTPLPTRASDFTVGSVRRGRAPAGPGNFFKGVISGIAVFDRALNATEMDQLSAVR